MEDENPKMDDIARVMAKIRERNDPNEPTDPEIARLIEEGMRIVELMDPIVRETMRDQPEKLAEWDKIMHMCDEDDEIDEAKKLGTAEAPVIRLEDEAVQ